MKDEAIIALFHLHGGAKLQMLGIDAAVIREDKLLAFAKAIADPLQYKIDQLVLEYCPDEMTKEQADNWAAHQKISPESDIEEATRKS